MSRQNAGIDLQILIVKSSPDSLDYNQLLNCDRQSYQIQECELTSEALEICQHLKPDCILLNWESSKLNRKKFLEHLGKNLIPVVILVESEHQDLAHSYVVKETLTKELLCFAIDQAIAQTALKRKLAEAELKLQQSQDATNYEISHRKTLFNSSIDGIVILNQAGNIIEANISFAKMLGYELAEITTLNLADFEARWTRSELEQQRNQSQQWANRFATRHRRKDGSIYDVEISSNSVNWHGQTVEFCICRDISEQQAALRERKIAEEVLKQSELKLRKLTENIPVVLYQFLLKTDGSMSCPFMSHGSYSLYGLAPEVIEADVNAVISLAHPQDLSTLDYSIQLSTQTLEPWKWEGRIYTTSGELKWISGIAQPELLENGDILWHGMVRDISDRKQIEKDLEISEVNNRTTLEAIPDLLLRLDRNGTCIAYIQPVMGSENFLPIEKDISEVLPPDLLQNQLQVIDRAIATGELQVYEHQFLKQNTIFFEEVRIIAINDHEVLAIIRDITNLRKAEAFLELQNRFFRCIAIGDPLPDTLDLLLRLIELEIDDALCSILIVDHQDRLNSISDMYLPTELSQVFDGITTDQAEIIFGINPLNLIDIGANSHWQNYKQLFRSQGLTTCWSVPINTLNGQKILGILNLYFQEAKQISIFPTIFEDKIIKFSAYVIGIAIERHQAQIDLQFQLQRERILNLRIQQELSDRKAAEAELQQSQERLRQSEELLRLTIENTPNGICTFNLETQFLSVNQHICQMYGYSSGEMLKTNVSDLIHPDFSEILLKGIRNLYAGRKKTIRIENQYIHKNGMVIDAISRFSIVQDAFEQPLHIVGSIQDITKQKHIEIALDQRMERQSFLMMITRQIRQSLNLDQVVGNAVNEVKRLLDCHQVAIVQLLPEGAIQVIKDQVDPVYASILNFDYLDLDFFTQRLDFLISANTLILNGVSDGIIFDDQIKIDSFQSRLIAPIVQHTKNPDQNLTWIKNENQLWGLLIAHSCGKFRQWQPEEAELIQNIANQLAIAIQQAGLYEQIQNELVVRKRTEAAIALQLRRQETLLQVTQQIRESLHLKDILSTVTQQVKELMQVDRVIIFRLFPDGKSRIVEEAVGNNYTSLKERNWEDEEFAAEIMASYLQGNPRTVPDVMTDVWAECLQEYMIEAQVQTKIVAPILQESAESDKGRWVSSSENNLLWGLLIIHACKEKRIWENSEALLLQQIANQLAIAIQQASLYEQVQNELLARHEYERELEKQAASDRLLSEITIAISQSADIDKTIDTYLPQVQQFVEADRIIIYQFQPNYQENYQGIVVKEEVSRLELSIIGTIITDSCFATTNLGEQYRNGKITKISDTLTSNLDPCYLNLLKRFQVRSNLVIPILHSSQLWGLLILHQCDRPRHWQPWEITFLQQIATQIGIASQKEKLYLQLSSELSQKKILLKEIHHRVKNNLQVMSSILFLQFRNTPPEVKLLTEEYQNRIQAMSLIHEQLYRSDDLANIDFSNYVGNLTSNLFQCYGTSQELIQISIEVNNIFLPLDQAIPLGLIINELVSNALKYAFPKMHGTITIKLVKIDANIILTVSDDGVGIPADFDLANADGLGMQLIQSLTEQLDGEFSFDGKNGLMVQISFPHFSPD